MDELKYVQSDISCIPEGCLSFVEETNYVVAAIDEDFEDLMESMGLDEGCKSESDDYNTEDVPDEEDTTVKESYYLFTEAGIGEAKDKVVGFLKEAWARIKGVFEKITSWIKEQVKNVKQKGLDKFAAKFKEAYKNKTFKDDDALGSIYTNTVYDKDWINTFQGKVFNVAMASASGEESDKKDLVNKIPGCLLDSVGIKHEDGVSIKTMKNQLKIYFLTGNSTGTTKEKIKPEKVTSKVLNDNPSLVKLISGIITGDQLQVIKKDYNSSRKYFKTCIANVKKSKKETSKSDKDKDEKKLYKKNYAAQINCYRRAIQVLSTAIGAELDCIRKQNRKAYGIAVRVITKLGRKEKKKEEKTNESYIFAW